jgi:hypothetical protein
LKRGRYNQGVDWIKRRYALIWEREWGKAKDMEHNQGVQDRDRIPGRNRWNLFKLFRHRKRVDDGHRNVQNKVFTATVLM